MDFKEPSDIFYDRCSRFGHPPLQSITLGAYLQLVEDAKAAKMTGISLTIGGRGTKLYPQMAPYFHYVTSARIAPDAIEIRGSELRIGVDVVIEDAIEKLAIFA